MKINTWRVKYKDDSQNHWCPVTRLEAQNEAPGVPSVNTSVLWRCLNIFRSCPEVSGGWLFVWILLLLVLGFYLFLSGFFFLFVFVLFCLFVGLFFLRNILHKLFEFFPGHHVLVWGIWSTRATWSDMYKTGI